VLGRRSREGADSSSVGGRHGPFYCYQTKETQYKIQKKPQVGGTQIHISENIRIQVSTERDSSRITS